MGLRERGMNSMGNGNGGHTHTDTGSTQHSKQTRQKQNSPRHITAKILNRQHKEKIVSAARKIIKHVTRRGKLIRITADVSTTILKTRTALSNIDQILKDQSCYGLIKNLAALSSCLGNLHALWREFQNTIAFELCTVYCSVTSFIQEQHWRESKQI